MVNRQMGTVLRHIRQIAAARDTESVSDGELLNRFSTSREETAFAALVQRHGRMVWGVCRHVLSHEQDAEDVFQATFLVLAQKAGAIRDRQAVGSWLHGTAYRLALRAKRDAATRRAHERRGQCMPREKTFSESALREALALVYEEVQGLPDKHRAAFVLCCLEGKTLAEAARQLGWKEKTVSSAVSRARQQLRVRLVRRGVALTAAMCAIPLAQQAASAAVPAMLLKSTVTGALTCTLGKGATTAAMSAGVATLVQGATKSMSTMKLKTATVLFLVLGIGAAGLAIRSHQAIAAQQADREQHAAAEPTAKERPQPAARPAKPKANDSITVRGLVLGPDGKPFAGAKLYLNHSQPKEKGFAERATSGADGRFEFTIAKSELGKANAHNAPPQVMAAAKGHGCDWATVSADGKTGELTLRLVKDVPISGRILDPDGKPVVGAKIKVTGASAPKGDDLGGYLEAVRKGYFQYRFAKDWAGPLPGRTAVLTTGADGRFKLAGFGRERVVHLHVTGPAIASTGLEVMTRANEKVKGAELDPFDGVRHVYGAAFDYVAVASRPIRGVVRDKATGKPLAGAWVYVEYWVNRRGLLIRDQISPTPKPVNSFSRTSALPSPSRSARKMMSGAQMAMTPSRAGITP